MDQTETGEPYGSIRYRRTNGRNERLQQIFRRKRKGKEMRIRRVTGNRESYLHLLLLADEQMEMIREYLNQGDMIVLEDGEICGECIVTDAGDGALEIRNLAVLPGRQRKGYGRAMIEYIAEHYRDSFSFLQAGTGDSPLTVPFYEDCGFIWHHVEKDYFTTHYDHPIVEQGVQLRDRVILRRAL